MSDESQGPGKGVFFDRVSSKVTILQSVTFEMIHDLLSASGSEVTYMLLPEGFPIAECSIDGVNFSAMLLQKDGSPVESVEQEGETIIFRLVLAAPEETPPATVLEASNQWNIEHISGRSFFEDGRLYYEFRIPLGGVTADYFEDHLFEWYDTMVDFIHFVVGHCGSTD
ncbi:YbjN domain-containing protein [Sulfitobacter sp. R18_1]|uniref:YbjN domain-containing protein n=1 Tax=Sulfitobacter sp. R18_1 TaxID=2821104 RepID=UPI001ADC30E7|nr:YbjN domain-containing protein [Sulfitobacter sp. R18_1]MBO9428584.1 YbjN domain-containing protein [Sulfitobacter sp. R18_1]